MAERHLSVKEAAQHEIWPRGVCEKTTFRALKRGLASRLVANKRWI